MERRERKKGLLNRIEDNWVEIVAAVLLSLAVVGTAWCGYQSARWSGVQMIRFSEASAARDIAGTYDDKANQETLYDVLTFYYYMDMWRENNPVGMDLVKAEFMRDEFKELMDAWLASNPLLETTPWINPDSPSNPFFIEEFKRESRVTGETYMQESQTRSQEAKDSNQQSDNYVLLTVVFASVLFFAGISTKFTRKALKISMIGVGTFFIFGALIALGFQSIC